MRPVGRCVTEHASLCPALRLAARERKYAKRAVSVPSGSTWVPLDNVWQQTSALACMMDSSTSQMMSTPITPAFGVWRNKCRMGRIIYFCCLIALFLSSLCGCSYCENGSMRCSSSEVPSLLSDLFYDEDLGSTRGTSLDNLKKIPSPQKLILDILSELNNKIFDNVPVCAERRSAHCPPPLVRTECGSGKKGLECARTCQNLDLPCVSLSCIPGCLCPPDTVCSLCICVCDTE